MSYEVEISLFRPKNIELAKFWAKNRQIWQLYSKACHTEFILCQKRDSKFFKKLEKIKFIL